MGVITDFVHTLRTHGADVSIHEVLDIQKTLSTIPLLTRSQAKALLRTVLIKRVEDFPIYEYCFEKFFSTDNFIDLETANYLALADHHPASAQDAQKNIKKDITKEQHYPARPPSEMNLAYSKKKKIFLRWLSNTTTRVGELLLQNRIDTAGKLLAEMASQKARTSSQVIQELNNLKYDLMRSFAIAYGNFEQILYQSSDTQRNEAFELLKKIEKAHKIADREILKKYALTYHDFAALKKTPYPAHSRAELIEQLLDTPFPELRINVEQIKKELLLLGKKIATKELRKRQLAKKGSLDFRKTMRMNISNGGTLFNLIYKKKRIEDPKIILLTDISSSTSWVADWFFIISYTARMTFRHIRIFEFDSTIVEVTDALHSFTLENALKSRVEAWRKPFRTRHYHSNYETTFEDFLEYMKHGLDRKTTVIILGDCRDFNGSWVPEGLPRSALLLKQIIEKVKRVIILNPEPYKSWNTGDSVVFYYQQMGAEVHQVSTLRDLIEFVLNFEI